MTWPHPPATQSSKRRAAVVRLILPVIAAGLALSGCQSVPDPTTSPTSQESTVKTSEFSTLDAAGVDSIRASGAAKLDMSSGRLEKSAVQVTPDSFGPEINTRDAGKITLTIVAPDGEITAQTDRIRFNTTASRSDFSEVTFFLTAASDEEYFGLIRDAVTRYGIDAGSAERWISGTEADPSGKSDFAITAGTSTGLEVTYDLRFNGETGSRVIMVHVRPLD